jgi:hypothetical protein
MLYRCALYSDYSMIMNFFKIGIVGGGVQLGPLATAATNRTTVPAPGDYDDGEIGEMMIGRGYRSTRRKKTNLTYQASFIWMYKCRFVHHKPHMLPGREPGAPQWEASD